jgi:hypothetical protein
VNKKAIVTLAVGAEYAARFEALCRPNWAAYAERHGYDLVVITKPLDNSARAQGRSPAWQKCLIFSAPQVADYERVVWVDSDILINPSAPSIVEGVPPERIGVTDEHAYPSPAVRQDLVAKLIEFVPESGTFNKAYWRGWTDAGVWHADVGLSGGQTHIVQTGVMVMSPFHRGVLETVYREHEDTGRNMEMRFLSHAIQSRGLQHWLDPKFNALLWWLFLDASRGRTKMMEDRELRAFMRQAYASNYFLHFAGAAQLMRLLG